MKTLVPILILFAISVPGEFAAGQSVAAPFSLAITASQDKARVGSEVKIEIVLKNTSDANLSVARSNAPSQAEFHFLIDVRDTHGREAPDTEYGRRITGRETKKRAIVYGSDIFFTLKPNETLTDEAVLTKLYDLSRPGVYLVQVSRLVAKGVNDQTIKSNTISVTVSR